MNTITSIISLVKCQNDLDFVLCQCVCVYTEFNAIQPDVM